MENKIKELNGTISTNQELNRKLNALVIKYKDSMHTRYNILDFEQPCMILLRKGRRGEFLESTRKNGLDTHTFKFRTSEGDFREIDMEGAPLYTFPYGKKQLNVYLHHETWFRPFNFDNPLYSFQQFNTALAHTFSSLKKWEVEAKKAFALNWKYLAFLILALGVVLLIYLTMRGNQAPSQTVIQLGNQTLQTMVAK